MSLFQRFFNTFYTPRTLESVIEETKELYKVRRTEMEGKDCDKADRIFKILATKINNSKRRDEIKYLIIPKWMTYLDSTRLKMKSGEDGSFFGIICKSGENKLPKIIYGDKDED